MCVCVFCGTLSTGQAVRCVCVCVCVFFDTLSTGQAVGCVYVCVCLLCTLKNRQDLGFVCV